MKKILLVGCTAVLVVLIPELLVADELDGGTWETDGGVPEDTGDVREPEQENEQEEIDISGETSEDEWGEDDGWGEDEGWGDDAGKSGSSNALTSPKVTLHGVFENQLQGMWLKKDGGTKNDALINDYTKLRVELDAALAGNVALKADAVARIFAGDTEMSFNRLLPKRTRDSMIRQDQRWAPFFEETYAYENDYYINNAYLKLPVGPLVLFVGKQPLEQGVGYVWNPTDVFTKKDMFDPTYEKPGVVALRAKAALGEQVSLDLVGVPNDDFKRWIGGGRGAVIAGPVRLSAAAYVTDIVEKDLANSLDAMMGMALLGQNPEDGIITHRGRRVMVGGEVVLDIEGMRLWVEGAYNIIEDKEGLPDDYFEAVGGAEYFFESETHVMVEYLHYGKGPTQTSGHYGLNDWMALLDGDLKMLGKDFLFESIDHPIADFWTLGLSSFQSISDVSATITGDAKWQFKEDAELWLLLSYAVGERDDYLSSARGQAWLRLTAYF